MSKEQTKKIYQRPKIEVMYACIDSPILDASYPGDHKKGNHKPGPAEESSEGAKPSFFFKSGEENASTTWGD